MQAATTGGWLALALAECGGKGARVTAAAGEWNAASAAGSYTARH